MNIQANIGTSLHALIATHFKELCQPVPERKVSLYRLSTIQSDGSGLVFDRHLFRVDQALDTVGRYERALKNDRLVFYCLPLQWSWIGGANSEL